VLTVRSRSHHSLLGVRAPSENHTGGAMARASCSTP
jgi:hypothetical protein